MQPEAPAEVDCLQQTAATFCLSQEGTMAGSCSTAVSSRLEWNIEAEEAKDIDRKFHLSAPFCRSSDTSAAVSHV